MFILTVTGHPMPGSQPYIARYCDNLITNMKLFVMPHHRPAWLSEPNGQDPEGHPAVTGHVHLPGDQEAVLPSVLLPLQWWPLADPGTIKEPWGSESMVFLNSISPSYTYSACWKPGNAGIASTWLTLASTWLTLGSTRLTLAGTWLTSKHMTTLASTWLTRNSVLDLWLLSFQSTQDRGDDSGDDTGEDTGNDIRLQGLRPVGNP